MSDTVRGSKACGYEYGGKRDGMPGYHHYSRRSPNWVKQLTTKKSRQQWSNKGNDLARG